MRGRAWAIHDGILEAIDARWDGLRMVKQVGRHAGLETFPVCLAAELESLGKLREFIKANCRDQTDLDEQIIYDLKLAVDEACSNIITHGYEGMNPGSIILNLELTSAEVIMTITDFGQPFEPSEAPMPDVQAGLDDRPTGGFGLYFIYQTMDTVDYKSTEDGNHLILVKNLQVLDKEGQKEL